MAEAIRSALAQTHPPMEVLVVDDGSRDESAAIARGFPHPVRVLERPNGGAGAARNTGAGAAAGDFLAFLDADDVWSPDKLSRQLARFTARPELDLVFTNVRSFLSPDLAAEEQQRIVCPSQPMPGLIPSSLLVRRSSFERCGPFPEDLRVGELIPWLGRAGDLGLRSEVMADVLVERRLHNRNLGRMAGDRRQDYLSAVKQMLDRRRQSQ
ncbi:MAG: glycosyltransferase family A protein [Acidobacteria bacterium]|nr:glycosyltransferase family A protein [Acidobacteriota bacterium]